MPEVGVDLRHENGGDGQTDVGGLRGALLAHAVARRDVADFMSHHGGQFRLAVEIGHDAARDVDITAGQREGVDFGRIQHGEAIVQAGAMALLGEPLPDAVDVILQRFRFENLILLFDLFISLAANGDFLVFRHHHKIVLSGDRILGAAGQQRKSKADNQ